MESGYLCQDLNLYAPFFSLRELCATHARVCAAWRTAVYADARWRVLRDTDLRVFDDAAYACLSRRQLPLVQRIEMKRSVISASVFKNLVLQCPALTAIKVRCSKRMSLNEIEPAIEFCPLLHTFDCNIYSHEDSPSKVFSKIPNLQHVYTSQLDGNLVAHLRSLPSNQLLSFGASYASSMTTSKEIEQLLTRHSHLEVLLVRASGFVDATSAFLGPSIRELNIHGCMEITDFTLKNIAQNCPNLGFFEMGGATHTNGTVLTCTKVSDEGLLALSQLQKIYALGIFHCHTFSAKAIKLFARRRTDTLTRLDIGGLKCINDTVLEEIAINAPKLERLDLEGAKKFTYNGLARAASHLRNLRKVRVFGCKGISDPLPQKIEWGWNIKALNFYACRIMSDEAFTQIMEACGKSLEKLEITSCNLSDKGLKAVATECSNLKHLGANFLKVSDEAMAEVIISNKKTLEFVDIHYTIRNEKFTVTTNAILNCCKRIHQSNNSFYV